MHGQKKRRKRSIDGVATIDGHSLVWELLSEPQWSSSGDGYKGLCLSVRVADAARRELIIEFPYPTDKTGRELPLPQRPDVSQALAEKCIRQALNDGWSPDSRGKAFVFYAPASPQGDAANV